LVKIRRRGLFGDVAAYYVKCSMYTVHSAESHSALCTVYILPRTWHNMQPHLRTVHDDVFQPIVFNYYDFS